MKKTYKILITGLMLLFLLPSVNGQKNLSNNKLNKARMLLSDYRDASFFRDQNTGGYDPSWEEIFRSCFDSDSRRIIMDIPFRQRKFGSQSNMGKPTGALFSDTRIINSYQELVTVDEYIEIIRNAYFYHKITDFSYNLTEIGSDTTNLNSANKILFEVRKTFSDTPWSVSADGTYIIEIQFVDEQPKIISIRQMDENVARTHVSLTFVNSTLKQNDPEYRLKNVVGKIRIEFDESINNRELIAETDNSGVINLGLVPNRATIKVDTVMDAGGNKYSVPDEWKKDGKKVGNKQGQGFEVSVQSMKWNGFSWSVRGFGGIISQSENQLTNFSPDTYFENDPGFKYGFGIEIVKLYSLKQIAKLFGSEPADASTKKLTSRRNTYFGGGMGISYYQYKYNISGGTFSQNPYNYSDRLGTPVQVLVSGSAYEETTTGNGFSIPLFAEFRKVLPDKKRFLKALSFQGGLNLLIPLGTKHEISGDFSRYGLYEQFNPQPITDDPFYNYYSQTEKVISETAQENSTSTALMFSINGYFDVSGKKSDNLLDVGLLMWFPFNNASSSETGNFYLSTGNDEFSSMSDSKSKIYNYFIGLSVGYNFIRYQ